MKTKHKRLIIIGCGILSGSLLTFRNGKGMKSIKKPCLIGDEPISKSITPNFCLIIYSPQNIYKEKIEEFDNFSIKSISFILRGRNEEYKKEIRSSLFRKFKYAIASHSKPFTLDKGFQEATASAAACGHLVFYSKQKKVTIDICGKMFFWGGERKLKYAFVSKDLTNLIIGEIKRIKDQKDVAWIIDVLQESIKPSSRE
jgi:hypothetical protein